MSANQSAYEIDLALKDLPMVDRMAALAVSAIFDAPSAPEAIAVLIQFAAIMTKHLPDAQRVAVKWHLNEIAAEIDARWN